MRGPRGLVLRLLLLLGLLLLSLLLLLFGLPLLFRFGLFLLLGLLSRGFLGGFAIRLFLRLPGGLLFGLLLRGLVGSLTMHSYHWRVIIRHGYHRPVILLAHIVATVGYMNPPERSGGC